MEMKSSGHRLNSNNAIIGIDYNGKKRKAYHRLLSNSRGS
jgi:hypothetical protein